jgi:transposase-like protein
MAAKVICLADRLQQKWARRASAQSRAGGVSSGKKYHVTCKCPRCGAYHDAAMHWTGRGTPRLFCPSCRNRVSSLSSIPLLRVSSIIVRNMRRGAYQENE